MSNGRDFFDFDFDVFFGRRPSDPERDPGPRGRQTGGRPPVLVVRAFPLPVPTFPTSTPAPPPGFPTGPAANEPFPRVTGPRVPGGIGALGRIFGLGGLVITAADIIVRVLEGVQLDRLGDIVRRQAEEIANINIDAILQRELDLEIEKRIRALETAPETFEVSTPEPQPAPLPRRLPVGDPDVIPTTPDPFPVTLPSPITVPGPVAPTLPAPSPAPVPAPLPAPSTAPGRRRFPVADPLLFPVTDPFLAPIGDPDLLTPFDATPVPSPVPGPTSQFAFFPDPQLQPNPQQNPDERCKRKCDEQETRTQCFKGLYRETTRSTEFTEWTEIDCVTGKELDSPSVLRDVTSQVTELF